MAKPITPHKIIADIEYKLCPKCHQWLSLNNFCRCANTFDQLQSHCKHCRALANNKLYHNNSNYRQAKIQQNGQITKQRYHNDEMFRQATIMRHTTDMQARRAKAKNQISLQDVINIHGAYCEYCGATENLTMDHIIPIARGGQHTLSNLTVACQKCNCSKGAKLLEEWEEYQCLKKHNA
jgi:5-methylcytosine-specific restriction endonuclease McrA